MVAFSLLVFGILAANVATATVEKRNDPWTEEFGKVADMSFSGIVTFAHLPYVRCLDEPHTKFDIALLGVPFDAAVSYRPGESCCSFLTDDYSGARFGPSALRSGRSELRARLTRSRFSKTETRSRILEQVSNRSLQQCSVNRKLVVVLQTRANLVLARLRRRTRDTIRPFSGNQTGESRLQINATTSGSLRRHDERLEHATRLRWPISSPHHRSRW